MHKIPDHDLKLKALVKYGTMGAVLAYGAEKQITGNSALDFAVNVAFPQGVSVKIRLARANQNYIFQVDDCLIDGFNLICYLGRSDRLSLLDLSHLCLCLAKHD